MAQAPNVRTRRRAARKTGGFATLGGEELSDMRAAGELPEASRIDEIVEKYTGTSINLDEAFPEPPPPVPPHAALTGVVRVPESNKAYNRPNPADAEALAAENAYRREHELKVMHRLLMRNATVPQIANALDKSTAYVLALRHELERRLAAEAANLNVMAHSASTLGFYREMRGIALRNVDMENMGHRDKARYMTLAIAAENNMHRFLQVSGFYDGAPMRPQVRDEESHGEMAMLAGALKAMLNPEEYEQQMLDVLDGDDGDAVLPRQDPDEQIRVL